MENILLYFIISPAWKIFSLLVIPFISVIMVISLSAPIIILKFSMLLGLWTTLLWLYAVGVLISEKYAQYITVPIHRFKLCLAYDFFYSFIFPFGIIPFEYLKPFSFVSIACNIYALYFVSKLIVGIERKSDVKFYDYIGTFIAVWIFIFGIWSLQPRVKKIYLSNEI